MGEGMATPYRMPLPNRSETPATGQLFLESVYDALRAIVDRCGGPKAVAARLWTSKNPDDARKLLLDCLNPARAEKLDPEQVIHLLRMAREADYHEAKHWLDEATGYQPSAPADPEIERDRLIDTVRNAAAELRRATEALARLEGTR